jgi:hypothetical protein
MSKKLHPDPDTHVLLCGIVESFSDVTRQGGRSWSDALALDLMGVPGVSFHTTHREDDTSWLEVAQDAGWIPDAGLGGWAFLDGVGFRYYLAAAMYRAVKTGEGGCLAYQITLPPNGNAKRRFLDRWILNERQHHATMRVAEFMRERMLSVNDITDFDEWDRAIQSWADYNSH